MQLNNLQQRGQQHKPYLKPTNNIFYGGVISELNDDEDPINFDFIFSTIVKTQSLKPFKSPEPPEDSFSHLTKSQKKIQTQKIYQQSRINSFMFDVRQLITRSKNQVLYFLSNNPKRSNELTAYTSSLQELDEMIRSVLGATDQVKIFMVKKVVEILKRIGKISQGQQYTNLVKQINEIAGIEDNKAITKHGDSIKQNKQLSDQTIEGQCSKVKLLRKTSQLPIRGSRRSLSMKICLQKQQQNKNQQTIERMKRIPYFFKPSCVQDIELDKILNNVDEIHENHLRTWQKHNQELKEFQAQRVQIRQRHSCFHNKMLLNRKIGRHSSLKRLPSSNQKRLPKISSFENKFPSSQTLQQPQEPRGLINEAEYFSRQPLRKVSRNENEIRFKLLPAVKGGKKNQQHIRTRQSSWLSLGDGPRGRRRRSRMVSQNKVEKSLSKSRKSMKSSRSKSKSKKGLKSLSKNKSKKNKSNSVQNGRERRESLVHLNQQKGLKPALKSGNAKKNLKVSFVQEINSRKLLKIDR